MTPALDIPIVELDVDLVIELTAAQMILEKAAEVHGFAPQDLLGPRRTAGLVWARHLAMAATRRATTLSYSQIARFYGGRHHSSAMYACQRIEAQAKRREKVEAHVQALVEARQ